MAKNGNKANILGLIVGIMLIIVSILISMFVNNAYLLEIHSEIFGAGLVISIIALVFIFFKLRISG